MGAFLYPEDAARREEEAAPETREGCVGLANDVETRIAAVEIMFSLTRSAEGRQAMREQKCYEYLRLWDLHESDEFIKEKVQTIVNILVLSEQEIEKGDLDTASSSAKIDTAPSTP
jgi:hypothetical protein